MTREEALEALLNAITEVGVRSDIFDQAHKALYTIFTAEEVTAGVDSLLAKL